MSTRKNTNKTIVYDATDAILGRFASYIAKQLLLGDKIAIVNVEKVVISGSKKQIIDHYKTWLQIRTHTAPWKGPLHPRRPDRLFKRTVRGMLPKKKARGFNALKRLRAFIGIPEEYKNVERISLSEYNASRLNRGYYSLGELSKELGWNGVVIE
ncbi:MAG: 50S ribosomal protein L13 [Candidatus Helarchaeota archaeon]